MGSWGHRQDVWDALFVDGGMNGFLNVSRDVPKIVCDVCQ